MKAFRKLCGFFFWKTICKVRIFGWNNNFFSHQQSYLDFLSWIDFYLGTGRPPTLWKLFWLGPRYKFFIANDLYLLSHWCGLNQYIWLSNKLSLHKLHVCIAESQKKHTQYHLYTNVSQQKDFLKKSGPSKLIFNLEARQNHSECLEGRIVNFLDFDVNWSYL